MLNLFMEQSWWEDLLKEEKKNTEEFEDFAYNVCTTGCKTLSKAILQQDCSVNFLAKCLRG